MITGDVLLNGIGDFGFPAATFFMMYRLVEKTIKENTMAVKNLSNVISKKLQKA